MSSAHAHGGARHEAERLGIPLNQQLYSAEQLDAALAVREQEGLTTRVLGAFATFADEASDPGPNLAAFDHDDRVRSLENTAHVKEFSAAGGVIMGHDATVILAGRPNTLAVKLWLPGAWPYRKRCCSTRWSPPWPAPLPAAWRFCALPAPASTTLPCQNSIRWPP